MLSKILFWKPSGNSRDSPSGACPGSTPRASPGSDQEALEDIDYPGCEIPIIQFRLPHVDMRSVLLRIIIIMRTGSRDLRTVANGTARTKVMRCTIHMIHDVALWHSVVQCDTLWYITACDGTVWYIMCIAVYYCSSLYVVGCDCMWLSDMAFCCILLRMMEYYGMSLHIIV